MNEEKVPMEWMSWRIILLLINRGWLVRRGCDGSGRRVDKDKLGARDESNDTKPEEALIIDGKEASTRYNRSNEC